MNENVRELVITPSMRQTKLQNVKSSYEKDRKSSGMSQTTRGFMGKDTPLQLGTQLPYADDSKL